jgi:mono/diheme cytochrome c family protein
MKQRGSWLVLTVLVWVAALVGFAMTRVEASQQQQAGQAGQAQGGGAGQGRGGGWTLPQGAADEKSPLTVNDSVVANGKKLFASKCQRCHGPEGKGDGPDGEKEHQADMNLTVAARAARNPDGTVFYKIWNGRTTPKMPRFSEELSKEQVWAIVAYVQTLREK